MGVHANKCENDRISSRKIEYLEEIAQRENGVATANGEEPTKGHLNDLSPDRNEKSKDNDVTNSHLQKVSSITLLLCTDLTHIYSPMRQCCSLEKIT